MNLGIVTTGGTIAGSVEEGVIRPSPNDPPYSFISSLADLESIQSVSAFNLMSEDLTPHHWVQLANAVRQVVVKGATHVLVLHGTDTASYSAAALATLLSDLEVPVALTGSNVPITESGTDAFNNIRQALAWLREAPSGIFLTFAGSIDGPGYVHLGTNVRKYHAGGHAYRSVSGSPFATVKPNGSVIGPTINTSPTSHTPIPFSELGKAAYIKIYPGMDIVSICNGIDSSKTGAIVVELYPSFTGPTGENGLPQLAAWAQARGIVVFGCTAEPSEINLKPYESTVSAENSGIIYLPKIAPEVAYVRASLAGDQSGAQLIDRVQLETPTDRLLTAGISR